MLRSNGGLKSQVAEDFGKKCFLNDPLRGSFRMKFCSKRIHNIIVPRLVCKFREIWPTENRKSRALFTWQKIFASLSRFRFGADRAKNQPDQRQTIYSECPKFRPNWFTSGGVIAERVNTVQTCHKEIPVSGRSPASSRIMIHEEELHILDNSKITISQGISNCWHGRQFGHNRYGLNSGCCACCALWWALTNFFKVKL